MTGTRSPRKIVVIGASAGGVEAITSLVSKLPADLDAALFVVLHLPPKATSHLPQIVSRAGLLSAVHPIGRTPIERGMIYVAPPDRHLIINEEYVTAVDGPAEHGHRPSADLLFRSAADSWGERVIGVVLSGNLTDGTAGLAAIQSRGGVALVQAPEETAYPGMPASAIAHVDVDQVLGIDEIAPAILRIAGDGYSKFGERHRIRNAT